MKYYKNSDNKVFAFESAEEMEQFAKDSLSPITAKQAAELTKPTIEQLNDEAKFNRAAAYVAEADPLFFKAQRGEATMEEWQAKVDEIRERFPYAEE